MISVVVLSSAAPLWHQLPQLIMSTPVIKQAFAQFPGVNIHEGMLKTIIRIIDINPQTSTKVHEQWVWDLMAEQIDIGFASHPCKIAFLNNGEPAQVEMQWAFTEECWKKMEGEGAAPAICISHLRALHEMMAATPEKTCLIVLEGDVDSTENTSQLMACFLANWFGNPNLQETKYCALTFSDWHSGYSTQARGSAIIVPQSIIAPYFKLCVLKMAQGKKGTYQYKFVGQGARAIAYSREFAQKVLAERVANFWDLHLLGLLSQMQNKLWRENKYSPHMTVFCDPPVFTHVPTFTERFRGSGRLQATAVNAAEETSYYVTLSLNHEWGMANRLQTIALIAGICSVYRCGLYILWTTGKACPGGFEEICVLDQSSDLFDKVPFIKFYNKENSHWKAACNHQHWHLHHFESQCQVPMGLKFFFDEARKVHEGLNDTYGLEYLIPAAEDRLSNEYCWGLINITDEIFKAAWDYVQPDSKEEGTFYVGVHCRRGDHKYMNCEAKVDQADPKKSQAILDAWESADDQLEVPVN